MNEMAAKSDSSAFKYNITRIGAVFFLGMCWLPQPRTVGAAAYKGGVFRCEESNVCDYY